MVAVQVLLMNYFLLGLHTDNHIDNDILPSTNSGDIADCSSSCSNCSPMNGCLMCKPPFVLVLRRNGPLQSGYCREYCPKGLFPSLFGNISICIKCDIKGCKECSSEKICIKCRKDYDRVNNKCTKNCPTGYSYDVFCSKCTKIRKEPKDNCSTGCTKCSAVNGCLHCRPPFVLTLFNDGLTQKGSCRRCCPPGSHNYFVGKSRLCLQSDTWFNATLHNQNEVNNISKYLKNDFIKYRKKKRRKKNKKRRNREKRLKKIRRHKKKMRRKAKKMKKIRHCKAKMRKARLFQQEVANLTISINK